MLSSLTSRIAARPSGLVALLQQASAVGHLQHLQQQAFSASAMPEPQPCSEEDDSGPSCSGDCSLQDRIGVIGAGQMSTAMIRGWLDAGLTTPTRVCTSDRGNSNQHLLSSIGLTTFGEAASGGAQSVAAESDIIVIGVKPQIMPDVLAALRPHVQPHHLVVSIAAGITLATYQQALPPGTRVIRVMPNTPLLVGAGASAYCLGQHARPEDEERIKALLGSSGLVVKVQESYMDAVTALSGSGPAFVFMMIESLADGGVAAGLPREAALQLAAQTVYGSAAMVMHAAGDGNLTHPGILKDRVASPAGTTIAGIEVLERAGMRGAVIRAVAAAAERSRELSRTS